jgi:hypothetical protein
MILSLRGRQAAPPRSCLQCGTEPARPDATICRRCGLRIGDPPSASATLPSCPLCYKTVDDDGRLDSLANSSLRVDILSHIAEHDRFPVGDDEFLESMRRGDRIRIGRWDAPFDVVRRYLVTGAVEAGRNRAMQHNAVVTAMAQIGRWGSDTPVIGDQPEWREARAAVTSLMERYHFRRA